MNKADSKKYQVGFKIERQGRWLVLKTDKDVICGFFTNYDKAVESIPVVRNRLASQLRLNDINAQKRKNNV